MPIGVVARQARDLEPEHEADVGERDLGSEPGEARSRHKAGAGESEVLIDDDDAIGGPAEFTGFGGKRILSIGRLAIVLDLGGAGLAQVDDRLMWRLATAEIVSLDAIVRREARRKRPAPPPFSFIMGAAVGAGWLLRAHDPTAWIYRWPKGARGATRVRGQSECRSYYKL
jgi:hypothetical protein